MREGKPFKKDSLSFEKRSYFVSQLMPFSFFKVLLTPIPSLITCLHQAPFHISQPHLKALQARKGLFWDYFSKSTDFTIKQLLKHKVGPT